MAKVINISEAASIAMHAMIMIAQKNSIVNVNSIAEHTKSSRHHVAKILQRLVKEDFITSQRGPKGGFVLKKKTEDICFLDIFESIEGKIELQNCPVGKETCIFDVCFLKKVTTKMSHEFHNYLKNNYLSDFSNVKILSELKNNID